MPRVTVIDDAVLSNRPGRCEADWLHDISFEIWTALQEADMALVAQATVRLLVDNYDYPLIDDDLFQNYWFCASCLPVEVPTTDIRLLGGKTYGDPPGLCSDIFMSDETRLTLVVDFPDGISEDFELVTKFHRWRYTTTPPLDCLLRPGAYYPGDARIIPVVSNCARTLDPVVTSMSLPRAPDAAEMSQPPRRKKPPEFAAVIDAAGCQAVPVKFLGCVDAVLGETVPAGVTPPENTGTLLMAHTLNEPGTGTVYLPVGTWLSISFFGTEGAAQYRMGRTGLIQNYRLIVYTNAMAVPATLTIKINGVATALTTAIGAGFTGSIIVPGTVAVSEDDLVAVEITKPGAGALQLVASYDVPGAAGQTTAMVHGGFPIDRLVFNALGVGANLNGIFPFPQGPTAAAAEAGVGYLATHAGTLRRFSVKLALNPFGSPMPATLRINGVDTALTVIIPAGSTAVHSIDVPVAVAAGDVVTVVTDGTGIRVGPFGVIGTASYDYI